MPAIRFQWPAWGFSVFCLAVAAAALSLSLWQHSRAQQKEALQALASERMAGPPVVLAGVSDASHDGLVWRRASAVGTYDSEGGFLIDNRIHQRQPGFHVITPLALQDGWLLVNRGWIAATRPAIAKPPAPQGGEVTVAGLLAPDSSGAFELGEDTGEGGIWQNLKISRWESDTGNKALPVVLLADAAPANMVPVAAAPDFRADSSRGYRLQWLALALVAVIGWVAVGLRGRK